MTQRSGGSITAFASSESLFRTPSSISGLLGAADSLYDLHQLLKWIEGSWGPSGGLGAPQPV